MRSESDVNKNVNSRINLIFVGAFHRWLSNSYHELLQKSSQSKQSRKLSTQQ